MRADRKPGSTRGRGCAVLLVMSRKMRPRTASRAHGVCRAGRLVRRFLSAVAAVAFLAGTVVLPISVARAQPCAIYGGQSGVNTALFTLFVQPGAMCFQPYYGAAAIMLGANKEPTCGVVSPLSGQVGFQYTAYGQACNDWFAFRLVMPDNTFWDYTIFAAIYPNGHPFPPP